MATIDQKAELYRQKFGQFPPEPFGMTEARLEALIDRALARGTPISDEDVEAHLPPDAVA